jgi:hypothetical protein
MRVPTPIKSLIRRMAAGFYAILEVTGAPRIRPQRKGRKQ